MRFEIDSTAYLGTIYNLYPPSDIWIIDVLHYTLGSELIFVNKQALLLMALNLHPPSISWHTSPDG